MKKLLLILLLLVLIFCTKERIELTNKISYNIGADYYQYDASYTDKEYCGQRLVSIIGTNQDKMFLISIITDTLQSKTYFNNGSNIWAGEFRTWSEDMKVKIIKSGNTITGQFAGTVHFGERIYYLTNGKFLIYKQ